MGGEMYDDDGLVSEPKRYGAASETRMTLDECAQIADYAIGQLARDLIAAQARIAELESPGVCEPASTSVPVASLHNLLANLRQSPRMMHTAWHRGIARGLDDAASMLADALDGIGIAAPDPSDGSHGA